MEELLRQDFGERKFGDKVSDEDEITRDESREMATDIMATSTTKLNRSILLAPSSLGAAH